MWNVAVVNLYDKTVVCFSVDLGKFILSSQKIDIQNKNANVVHTTLSRSDHHHLNYVLE